MDEIINNLLYVLPLIADKTMEILLKLVPFVAYASLLISILVLWYSNIKPFQALTSIGEMSLMNEGSNNLTIGVPITVYNTGAKSGFIYDIRIILEHLESPENKALFWPIFKYNSVERLINKFEKKPAIYSYKGTFSGITLGPKELVTMELLFTLDENSSFNLNPGEHRIEVSIKTSAEKDYKKIVTRNEIINEDSINKLRKGTTISLLPFPYRAEVAKRIFINN